MERTEIIFLAGLIVALIWLLACVIMEGKNRKYVILAGAMIDFILFIICRSVHMLCAGVVGGLMCGLIPGFVSMRKYETAVREMHGVKNWVIVSVIFFIMVCMVMVIAYPNFKYISWK